MNSPLPTVGIIGGGQLARMMYQASIALSLPVKLLAETPDASAASVVADVTIGDYTDEATVVEFARGCDVVTFDHEHVPPAILRRLQADGVAVRPGPDALIFAQDKALMRARLSEAGFPCPTWQVVDDVDALIAFGDAHGWPVIAKTARGGYDGKGVWKLDSADEASEPFTQAPAGVSIVAEEWVDFDRELSVLIARSPSGQAVSYPVTHTIQQDGVCFATITPAGDIEPTFAGELQQLGLAIAAELDVVGLLAVELMQRRDGSVVINELAMRPHNTGHWSIDGAVTSQFENHLRAVADLGLGAPFATDDAVVMVNVLGGDVDAWPSALAHVFPHDPRLHLHWYGKQWRPGRKLGHVTCVGDDVEQVRTRAEHGAAALRGETQ